MNRLLVYPTSRALRNVSAQLKNTSGFLPSLMRMDEFETRLVLLEGKRQVDTLQRTLYLKEAANFKGFEHFKFNRDLVRFFTRSDAIFKFFEELAQEHVDFETLKSADAYAEFETHMDVLEQLLENYKKMLDAKGYTDRAFIPSSYMLNVGFLQNYDQIEVVLEGYLSRFEFELLEQASKKSRLIIAYTTSKFTRKMEERFLEYGIKLPADSHVRIDMSAKEVIAAVKNESCINAQVFALKERTEQVAAAFVQIEKMVRSGIAPENIVLILPDEHFKEYFALFDTLNNLNFAMGDAYTQSQNYKKLQAIYTYWNTFEPKERELLEKYGLSMESVDELLPSQKSSSMQFMQSLQVMNLLEVPFEEDEAVGVAMDKTKQRIFEKMTAFLHTFREDSLSTKEWLFLWLETLKEIAIDDVRGGKVTVMGALETRGVQFEGVVIVDFNEGIVPAIPGKDQFLNSTVRAHAGLPTKTDREALQKQIYKRLLEGAKRAVIFYATAENRLPSKFLYELGLASATELEAQLSLLYDQPAGLRHMEDPVVESFDATRSTWSASRLKIWLECKRRYYYRYIMKIEPPKDERFNEGLFLHTLMEKVFEKADRFENMEAMRSELHRQMDDLLPKDDSKTRYNKLLWREKLEGLIEHQIVHFKHGWRVALKEQEVAGEIGGLKFGGRIDRIDQTDTHTLVLDYKSGSIEQAQKVKNLETLTEFQMSIYYLLLNARYPNLSMAYVKLLDGGEIEEAKALEEKNALLAEHIIALKQTDSFVAAKCETLSTCTYCEFALMCERGEYL